MAINFNFNFNIVKFGAISSSSDCIGLTSTHLPLSANFYKCFRNSPVVYSSITWYIFPLTVLVRVCISFSFSFLLFQFPFILFTRFKHFFIYIVRSMFIMPVPGSVIILSAHPTVLVIPFSADLVAFLNILLFTFLWKGINCRI